MGCVIFRNNLNEIWDFYHGTKPPTWVLVRPKYHFAMSSLLMLAKSQTPQGYLLEKKNANKRMQERSANITREKPPQRERESALGFLIFHGASESQSACQVAFGTSSACAQQLQFLSRTLFSLSSRKNSQFLMPCPSP